MVLWLIASTDFLSTIQQPHSVEDDSHFHITFIQTHLSTTSNLDPAPLINNEKNHPSPTAPDSPTSLSNQTIAEEIQILDSRPIPLKSKNRKKKKRKRARNQVSTNVDFVDDKITHRGGTFTNSSPISSTNCSKPESPPEHSSNPELQPSNPNLPPKPIQIAKSNSSNPVNMDLSPEPPNPDPPPDKQSIHFHSYADFRKWALKPDPTFEAILKQYEKPH